MLAERRGIYLDIVGLGSFRPEDDAAWYVDLPEPRRWAAQAKFWETIAKTLADRPGVFAFNLMNEPVVAGERLAKGAWVRPVEIEGLHYVHYINLDPDGRDRADIAVAWVRQMKQAIRMHDVQTPITVGMFPLLGSADASGFSAKRMAAELDFIAVHLYPRAGGVDETLEILRRYDVGLPIVIEEVFPLYSGLYDYRSFLERSRSTAEGWISFYWGDGRRSARARWTARRSGRGRDGRVRRAQAAVEARAAAPTLCRCATPCTPRFPRECRRRSVGRRCGRPPGRGR